MNKKTHENNKVKVLAAVFFLEQNQHEFCSTIGIRAYRLKRRANRLGRRKGTCEAAMSLAYLSKK